MPILLSVLGHHSEPGDPVLLDWLLHLFYSVVGLGPLAIVIVLGVIIVTIPVHDNGSFPHSARQVQHIALMKVEFANNRLRRCYSTFANASRAWGSVVARRYIQRVDELIVADNLNDLYQMPWYRLHRLSGQRAGQFSMTF